MSKAMLHAKAQNLLIFFVIKTNAELSFRFVFMAVALLHKTVFQGQSLSQNLINSLNLLMAKQI